LQRSLRPAFLRADHVEQRAAVDERCRQHGEYRSRDEYDADGQQRAEIRPEATEEDADLRHAAALCVHAAARKPTVNTGRPIIITSGPDRRDECGEPLDRIVGEAAASASARGEPRA
jgi:hypothetical protein